MQGCRDRIQKTRELQKQIQQRSAELQVKVKAAQAQQEATKESDRQGTQTPKPNWGEPLNDRSSSSNSPNAAQLDAKFEQWEMEMELEEMKRNLGR